MKWYDAGLLTGSTEDGDRVCGRQNIYLKSIPVKGRGRSQDRREGEAFL